ncbi:MAG: hypothetical protein L3K19_09240, partial [Thermoplasmata archaeon]|nr:hypothetical protein [Thermoplasmata archaeon]
MTRFRAVPAVAVVAVCALMLCSTPGTIASLASPPASSHPGTVAYLPRGPSERSLGPPAAASTVPSTVTRVAAVPHPQAPPVGLWNDSAGCRAKQAEWNATLGSEGAPPLDVDHRLQSPCYIG